MYLTQPKQMVSFSLRTQSKYKLIFKPFCNAYNRWTHTMLS